MRNNLDRLVTEKALSLVNDSSSDIPDQFESPLLKNVCAKVSVELSDEIDAVCNVLQISKRRFLEAAFVDAVDAANEIMRREGVFEAVGGRGE